MRGGAEGGSRGALAIRMPGGGCQMGCHNSDRQAAVRPEMEREDGQQDARHPPLSSTMMATKPICSDEEEAVLI